MPLSLKKQNKKKPIETRPKKIKRVINVKEKEIEKEEVGKIEAEEKERTRAQVRAERLDTASLYTWMDNSIMSLGASFDSWRYKDAPSSEVASCLEALAVVWSELEKRKNDRQR